MKKLLLLAFLFAINISTYGQTACADVNAGSDRLICNGQCVNLSATTVATGLTTNYTVSQTAYTPYPYTGTPLFIGTDDIWSNVINLPFSFCFYGNVYNQIVIGANGLITFDLAQAGQYCAWPIGGALPGGGNYNNMIGCPYHDIDPSVGGDVYYATYGTFPCRVFVVSWAFVPMYQCNNLIATQQLALFESTNIIETYIENKPTCGGWNAGAAIHGIQNANGTQAVVVPGRNFPTQWNTSNDGRRFTPSGGPPNITLTWTDNNGNVVGSGANIQVCPTATTTYTCTMDYNTCAGQIVLDDPVTVTVESPTVSANNNTPLCIGGTIQLSAAGSLGTGTFTWSNPAGNVIANAANTTIVNAQQANAGTYTVTYTTGAGCTASATSDVVINGGTTTISGVLALCDGASTVLSGEPGALSYQWSTGATTQSITVSNQGTVDITVTFPGGCTATASEFIIANTSPTATLAGTIDPSCANSCNGFIDINVSNGATPYSYIWSNGSTTEDQVSVCQGAYTVTVTDLFGCTGSLTNITINAPPQVVTTLTGILPANCAGACTGGADITVSGGATPYGYLWSNNNVTQDIFNVCAGTYSVTVTDLNGCTSTLDNIVVTEPPALVASLTNVVNPICFGACNGSIDITASGGTPPLSYNWGGAFGNVQDPANVCAGTYSVTVTDFNNCSVVVPNIVVTEPTAVAINTVTLTPPVCNGGCNGSVEISVSNGTAPYNLIWSNGQTGTTATGLCAGTYSVTATDANGCTASLGNITLSNPPALGIVLSNSLQPLCFGVCNGLLDITPNSGVAPFSYIWTNGATTEDLTAACSGIYSVTMTDANGCTGILQNMTLSDPPGLSVSLSSSTPTTCNGGADGALDILVSGGTLPYSFAWSNGPVSEDIAGVAAGTYDVQVTDANGCIANLNGLIVTEPTLLTATLASVVDPTCNGSCDGSIAIDVTGGTTANGNYNYAWSGPFGNVQDPTAVVCVGTYDVTVTDDNGCQSIVSGIVVNQPNGVAISLLGYFDATCNGACDGSISISATGGVAPITFLWDNGQTTNVATNLCAGNYNVTATDANGCPATLSNIPIIEPSPVTIALTGTLNASCAGDCNGAIDISASGGTPTYTFAWSNGPSSEDIANLCSGTYSVTATDINGCTGSLPGIVISEPTTLTIVLDAQTNATCFGGCNGTASITVLGGTTPYNFAWSNGEGTEDATALCAGVYTVSVTDANGCTAIFTNIQITEPPAILISLTSTTDATCNGACNGSIDITVSGGTGAYSYAWSGGFGNVQDPNGVVCAGTYSVTVTDANGCTAALSGIVVGQPTAVSIATTNITIPTCNGACDGSATVLANGGTPGYTYIWGNGQTGQTATGLCAGTYTVTATDANGCTGSLGNITVTQPTPVSITVLFVGNAACANSCSGSIDINVTGGTSPYNYAWSNGATGQDPNGLCDGNYIVTVTDANGCSATSTATITEPTLSFSNDTSICAGQSAQLSVTGTSIFNVSWTPGATLNNPASLTPIATPPTTTTYTATVLQVGNNLIYNGDFSQGDVGFTSGYTLGVGGPWGLLSLEGTYAVTNNPNAVHTGFSPCQDHTGAGGNMMVVNGAATPGVSVWCQTIQVSPNTDYLFSAWVTTVAAGSPAILQFNVGGVPLGAPFNAPATPCTWQQYFSTWNSGANTSITICIENLNLQQGGNDFALDDLVFTPVCTTTENITVTVNSVTAAVSNSGPVCVGEPLTLTATGGIDYVWDGPGAFVGTGPVQSIAVAGVGDAGVYLVTVSDANGCTATAGTIAVVHPNPTVSLGNDISLCIGGSTQLTAQPSGGLAPFVYTWDNGLPSQQNQTVTPVATTTYNVTVTDAHTCSGTDAITVTVNSLPTLSAVVTDVDCNGASTGAINVLSGGNGPFVYLWNPSVAATEDLSNIPAGIYNLTMTDINGCTATLDNIVVNEPTALVYSVTSVTNILCNGLCNGAIDIDATGGTPVISYSWSNGAVTQDLNNICAGVYDVTITDANGCSGVLSNIIVTEPPVLEVNIVAITDILCNGQCTGAVDLVVNGGTLPYTYLWNDGTTTEDLVNVCAGNTSGFTVTDANGCTDTIGNILLDQPSPLTINLVGTTDASCNGACDGSINTLTQGGTPGYSFSWSGPLGNVEDPINVCAGTYDVTVTDANLCTSTLTNVTITEPVLLTSSIVSTTNLLCNNICSGEIEAAAAGGTGPYAYLWPDGQTGANATGLCAGTYVVTITDNNGCTTSVSASLTEPAVLNASFSVTPVSCFGGSDGAIDLSMTGGVTPYDYLWSNADTLEDISGLGTGQYTLTVTDGNGCTFTSGTVMPEPTLLVATLANLSNVSCFGGSNGAIDIVANGGTPNYTYLWDYNGATTEDLANLPIGTYTVTVTDFNSCTATLSATIDEPDSLVINSLGVTDALCSYSCDGVASALASGGAPFPFGYIYAWSNGQVSPSATGLCQGTYTITATDSNGCTATTTTVVGAPTPILPSLTTTPVSCYGGTDGTATASATGGTPGYSYNWSNQNVGPFQPDLPRGGIEVTVTDANGCTASTASFVASPNPIFGNPFITNATCFGLASGTIALNPSGGTSPYSYAWSNGQTSALVVGIAAGQILSVTLTDANGCTGSLTGLTVGEPLPMTAAITVVDTNHCFGASEGILAASATGGTPAYQYEWSTFATGDTLTGLPIGTYSVIATDENGCSASATATMTQATPLFTSFELNNILCNGDLTGSITVDTFFGGTPPYDFSIDGNTYFNNINAGYQYSGLPAGDYSLYVIDANGCGDTTDITLSEPEQIIFSAGTDTLIQLGDSTVIDASVLNPVDGMVWEWTPTTDLSCADCLNPVASPIETTTYILTWTDTNGCSGSDDVQVRVRLQRRIFVPTGFTPNGDDLNDLFMVYGGTGVRRINKMIVFDRWGEVMFSATNFLPGDVSAGWDGTFKGKPLNPGVFVYYIEAEFEDNIILEYKGDVSLIRK